MNEEYSDAQQINMPTTTPVADTPQGYPNPSFNTESDIYTRPFNTIDVTNTIGDWVDAFNKNALASTDHTWYLGEMLFNGMLYTGLETIGGEEVKSLTNLNISSQSPQNLELDNFYLYFRNINKIVLVNEKTFDLSAYNTGQPMFFYINSNLGYRVSQEFNQAADEIMLFRFIISESGVFQQCYITSQRFGSSAYDSANEFYMVQGCQPLPIDNTLNIKLDNGTIKRSGIRIDIHQMPDVYKVEDNDIPFNLRYIESDNTVDFSKSTVTVVDPNHYLTYATATLNNVPNNKFTVQRILYDVYTDCLIMQYGDSVYDSMQEALSAVNNVSYPFPYNTLMFIPLGLMFIKKGAANLNDPDQCMLVQHLNTTITNTDSAFFAEDSYARGRIAAINNDIEALQIQLQNAVNSLNAHLADMSNPHNVTKDQVGLGLVDNMPYSSNDPSDPGIKESIENDLSDKWIKKNVDDSTTGDLTLANVTIPANKELKALNSYILVNGQRVYVGIKPGDAPVGSWAIALPNQ